MRQTQDEPRNRDGSPMRRGQKRTNTGLAVASQDQENYSERDGSTQRPHRVAMPSRKALEAIEGNRQRRRNSQYMEIDDDEEEL